MKLFDEMEKCFPEIEKHWYELQHLVSDWYFTPPVLRGIKEVLCEWIIQQYLKPESELYALFCQAGFENPRKMAALMIEWMHYVRRSEGRPYVIQIDTLPVRE